MNDELKNQLIKELLIEGSEGLDKYDQEMLVLEKNMGGQDSLNNIFRIIHTIKGSSGCVGFSRIEELAHDGENLLSMLRDGEAVISRETVTTLLALSDALREMFSCLESTGDEGVADYQELKSSLRALQSLGHESGEKIPQTVGNSGISEKQTEEVEAPAGREKVNTGRNDEPAGKEGTGTRPSVVEGAIRVDVNQLDKLMNLVGELVLARNQIIQFAGESAHKDLVSASQRLNIITTELQEGVMKTRMQPIGNIWAKFPRIVRDLSCELEKDVELVMEGRETELDRTIIEAIKDPLTHIIRNAIDHGMETTEERLAAGKPAKGKLSLRAFHEGGQVNIEMSDDGRGINAGLVCSKAVQKGIITSETASRLQEREIYQLIFSPGFSTAGKVTNVSGRGVGMDVVKTNIEKIGGSVDVSSSQGKGTTIKMKIPLTLAIIPALIVTSSGDRFAIPQVSLLELVRLEHKESCIEMIYGSPVYRLRGNLLPLIYLNKVLNMEDDEKQIDEVGRSALNIVVLQADGKQFGLIVDDINDTEEIVVKPMGKQLKGLNYFAGATIMGDGNVALILDVMGLGQAANLVSGNKDRLKFDALTESAEEESAKSTLLIFNSLSGRRMAIPLEMVDRLEEIPCSQVEKCGHQNVVQYRGQIMPLINVGSQSIPIHSDIEEGDPQQINVVVYSENHRSVGLVVGDIEDIIEECLDIKRNSSESGIVGATVVRNRVTELVDIPQVIRSTDPCFYTN